MTEGPLRRCVVTPDIAIGVATVACEHTNGRPYRRTHYRNSDGSIQSGGTR